LEFPILSCAFVHRH